MKTYIDKVQIKEELSDIGDSLIRQSIWDGSASE